MNASAEVPQPSLDELTARDLKRVWKTIVSTPNWWTTVPAYEAAQIERLYSLARRLK